MNAQPGLDDEYRRASPWPLFVALGLVISEIGVLFGFIPISVGGLLLFIGAIAATVAEAGYVDRPWRLLSWLAGALVLIGIAIGLTQAARLDPGAIVSVFTGAFGSDTNGVVARAISIIVAGIAGIVLGAVGPAMVGRQPT